MNFIEKYSGVVALVILAIMGVSGFFGHGQSFGSATACTDGYTCFTNLETQGNQIVDGTTSLAGATSLTSTLKVGASGTTITQINKGTSAIIGADTSVAATSTGQFDIAATGVASGDVVTAQLATSSTNGVGMKYGGWVIEAAKASSTSGFITLTLANFTGAAAVPSVTQMGSSTNWMSIR